MSTSWKSLREKPLVIAPLVILCQDYISLDEEFSKNKTIKQQKNDTQFWIDMAEALYTIIKMDMQDKIEPEYDEDIVVTDLMILKYTMDMKTRFELNDFTYQAIEQTLIHYNSSI